MVSGTNSAASFLAEGFASAQIESLHTEDFVNMLFFKKTATFKTA
jgi:hypothetical protein